MQNMKSTSISAGQPDTKAKNRGARANGSNGDASKVDSSKWSQPTHEQISALACRLYMESGCQEGRDAENWLKAEQILRQKAAAQAPSASRLGHKADEGREQPLRQ